MKKILIIFAFAIIGLVGSFSSLQLIQGIKSKFYPTPKVEQTPISAKGVNTDSNNEDNPTPKAEVQGKSTTKQSGVSLDQPQQEPLLPSPTPTPAPTVTQTPDKQQTIQYVPVPIYQSPSQTSTYNKAYWDEQIKQAEKEAEESRKAREAYDRQCAELTAQRNAALAPIESQLNETRSQLYSVEERINERTRGQFVSETQRLRMIEAESAELQNKLTQLQNEYNSVYAQYGSC